MSNCFDCYPDYLVRCSTEIAVNAQLAPLSTYSWIITDKFDRQYSGQFTTNENGFWTIDVDDLPAGLLTQFSGQFKLQVQDDSCKPIKFKIAQEYDCIVFELKAGTREKNTIGCDFECTPTSGSQTLLFPFTEQNVTIPWTPTLRSQYGNSPTVQVYHLVSGTTYQLVDVEVQHVFTDGLLTSIVVNNSGDITGYVLIS